MTQTIVLLLVPVVAGVAVGYALGGRLGNVAGRFRALWLLWLAAAVQASQYYLEGWRALVEDRLGIPLLGIVFALVLAWLVVNALRWPAGMRVAAGVVLLGALLNGAAIAANGRMPYSVAAAEAAGVPADATSPKNEPAGPATRLAFLGDVLPVPPLRKVVSAGDLLIAAGAAALVAVSMRRAAADRQPLPVQRGGSA